MESRPTKFTRATEELDPGLGTRVVAPRSRLILPGGHFHVRRTGLAWWARHTPYQWLAQIHGFWFAALAIGGYFLINTLFAFVYVLVGIENLNGVTPGDFGHNLKAAWFFSAQTLTTVGYGHVSPAGVLVSSIAAFEALVGLLGFGVWTGLLFSRFSRPRSRILFSTCSVLAPFQEGSAWMFRIVASHDQPLLDANASAVFSWVDTNNVRHYQDLPLVRPSVRFFPMNWTLVHAITPSSPLYEKSPEELATLDVEIMVLIDAHDESYGQTIHARSSWKAHEIRRGERFAGMMTPGHDGAVEIDLSRLSQTEPAPLPTT